jgi:hypothetical protein
MASGSGSRLVAQSHIELEERIRRRAYEIHQKQGGSEMENWLQAEQEVLGKSQQSAQDRGTTVGDARKPNRKLTERLGRA